MSLQELCRQYDIRFKKRLGQNLLLDDNINRIMTEAAALSPEDDVIEVGAGLGALTRHLCARAGRVLAVEIDSSFMPCLEDQFRDTPNVRLFRGDILNHSLSKLVAEFLPPTSSLQPRQGVATPCYSLKMVSNIPYYITAPILFHFIESPMPFKCIVTMVQEEVALRMVAPPNTPEYCALTLGVSYYAEVDIVHKVSRTCFTPRPKVDSCIVRLRRRQTTEYDGDTRFLMSVIRAAFSQRRKTLRNALGRSGVFGAPQQAVLEALAAADIDPARRPQTMSLNEFIKLAHEIKTRI